MSSTSIVLLIISTVTLIISILNLMKQMNKDKSKDSYGCGFENYTNYRLSQDNACSDKCKANSQLNPLLLSVIPDTIYNSDVLTVSFDKTKTESYIYVSKKDQIGNTCQVTPITIVLHTYSSINVPNLSLLASSDTSGIINGITSLGINQLFLNNLSVSVEIFIDCNTYQLMVKNIFLDISNGYNSATGQYDSPVTTINGTPYDLIINQIISNNSSTINFNTPSCSFNLKTCNDTSSQSSLDTDCKTLVNVLNSHIDNSLFPTVDLSNNTNVTGILKVICGN